MSEMRPPQQGPVIPQIRPLGPSAAPIGTPGPAKIPGAPVQTIKAHDPNTEPMALVDEPKAAATATATAPPPSKIKLMATAAGPANNYKRQPTATGHGACRVRSFHGRMSDEGLTFLDDKINEWLDNHPEIEIKFVTTQIGVFEGKIREPALVVNVWY